MFSTATTASTHQFTHRIPNCALWNKNTLLLVFEGAVWKTVIWSLNKECQHPRVFSDSQFPLLLRHNLDYIVQIEWKGNKNLAQFTSFEGNVHCVSFLICIFRLCFFSTCWIKQMRAASGLRADGVLRTPDSDSMCVCGGVHLKYNGRGRKMHRTGRLLLKNPRSTLFCFLHQTCPCSWSLAEWRMSTRRRAPPTNMTEHWLRSLVGHNFVKLIGLTEFHYAFITISNCFSVQYFILLPVVLLLLFIFEFFSSLLFK